MKIPFIEEVGTAVKGVAYDLGPIVDSAFPEWGEFLKNERSFGEGLCF